MVYPIFKEINLIKKDWRRVDLRIAFCYPNIYRAGMTGLTVQLLYALLNSREDVACERVFLPTRNGPLVSLESGQPLKNFDIVAFTLQYEEDYVNTIRMLIESNIPPRRKDRGSEYPIIMAGGPCAIENPLPLSDYIDLFFIGEVESVLDTLVDSLKDIQKIEDLADLSYLYVPSLPDAKASRVWVRDLNEAPHPVAQVLPVVGEDSPYMPVFGKALTVEVVRGCGRGCRFCLIGFIGRPKRERSLEKVHDIVKAGVGYTRVNKVSLIGAGLSDYSNLEGVCELLVSNGLELSIPSLRVEALTERLARLLVKGGQRTIALAPETGAYCLREIINKDVSDDLVIESVKTAFQSGIRQIKLYFMIGLPGETSIDVEAIADLAGKIADLGFGPGGVRLSINPFVPKPHTPFQWEPFAGIGYLRSCVRLIRGLIRDRRIKIDGIDPRHAQIQALLSVGDREVGRVVELVARYGGGLGAWRRALKECGVDIEGMTGRRSFWENLPWDGIDVGLNRRFLIKEHENMLKCKTTPSCEFQCTRCGVCEVA